MSSRICIQEGNSPPGAPKTYIDIIPIHQCRCKINSVFCNLMNSKYYILYSSRPGQNLHEIRKEIVIPPKAITQTWKLRRRNMEKREEGEIKELF